LVEREGEDLVISSFKTQQNKNYKSYYMIGTNYDKFKFELENIGTESFAYGAGLRNGDTLLKIDGKEILSATQLENTIAQDTLKKTISVTIERKGEELTFNNIIVSSKDQKEGLSSVYVNYKAKVVISEVIKGLPADNAGLIKGDTILSVDGITLTKIGEFGARIAASHGKVLQLDVVRGDTNRKISITPELTMQYDVGVDLSYINYPTPWQQFTSVVNKSYRTLAGVGAGIKNKIGLSKKKSSLKISNFSGPLGIVNLIGKIVYFGSYLRGLSMIVMITFSLGLLNLMPLPVLDGGHIVMALIQMIIRRPLPAKIVQPITLAFVVMLISFMLYVTAFDVKRFVGDVNGNEVPKGTTLVLSSN